MKFGLLSALVMTVFCACTSGHGRGARDAAVADSSTAMVKQADAGSGKGRDAGSRAGTDGGAAKDSGAALDGGATKDSGAPRDGGAGMDGGSDDAGHADAGHGDSGNMSSSFSISGIASGLSGTLVLYDNGGDPLSIGASGGRFTFATPLASGATYDVSVATPPPGQMCSVTNGQGAVADSDITDVQVSCGPVLSAPVLSLSYGIKSLQLSWGAVSGAIFYKVMQELDGSSGFTQVGGYLSVLSTTLEISVVSQPWSSALYLVEACGPGGCVASNQVNTLNGAMQSIGYFKASNTKSGQLFGYTVALNADGNTLAIGAQGESSNATGIGGSQTDTSVSNAGAVYVYAATAGSWSAPPVYIKASNTSGNQFFGYALALNVRGDTLAVGAFGERSNATGVGGSQTDTSLSNAGAVYVYTRDGAGTWSPTPTYVKASNTKSEQHFGYSVALSRDGTTLAVGAIGEQSNATGVGGSQTDTSMPGAGAVYVYTQSSGVWSSTPVYVKASNTHNSQTFGAAIALSDDGSVLAVGAWGERSNATGVGGNQTDTSLQQAGAVYVYTRTGGTWSATPAYIKASNTQVAQFFGYSLALSGDGNTLVVGAPGDTSSATGINGDQSDTSAPSSGAVYVYSRASGVWSGTPVYVKPSNTKANQVFGQTLALSRDGLTLAVGAGAEASKATGIGGDQTDSSEPGAGAVYVFTRGASGWSAAPTYVKSTNTRSNQGFAAAPFSQNNATPIALSDTPSTSASGSTLAVGAAPEQSNATGVGGNQTDTSLTNAGAVYLY